MNFPFRRSAPAEWAIRLPQLQRRQGSQPLERDVPSPEPGGLLMTLTRAHAPITAREVLADPARAEQLPPAALVQVVAECEAQNRELRRKLHAKKQELREMRQSLQDHLIEDGELRGRLRTLEDVIAALHANVEDLRLQRDQLLAQGGGA